MTLEQAVSRLNETQKALYALNHAMSILYVDGDTAAPRESYKGRGMAMGYLSELLYRQTVNDETGEVLQTILDNRDQCDALTVRQAELIKEEYDNMHVMPMEEFVAFEQLTNEAVAVWHEAKEKSDYALFAPYLEKMIDYERRYAARKDSDKAPYDVLLDQYEKGISMAQLDPFFKTLRDELSPVIKEISLCKQPNYPFMKALYPAEQQKKFSLKLMEMEGIDPNRCTIGETEHPFTDSVNKWDVRITTHYHEDNVFSGMFSVIHEGGHALYELGVGDEYQFTAINGGATMGLHESQSRFYENLICRSRPFCGALLPVMKDIWPEQMKDVTTDQLYAAINAAGPSLIRTEADELTYPLHVMIRYEIEKLMISGEAKVSELPEIWNQMYKKYLGVDVPNDREGILQDSHWSGASFGYFPSYALGSAYGVQMLRKMEKDIDVWGIAGTGDLRPITAWLGDRIHKYGKFLKPQELLLNAMGEPLDAHVYTDYLVKKYSDLYHLG